MKCECGGKIIQDIKHGDYYCRKCGTVSTKIVWEGDMSSKYVKTRRDDIGYSP